MKVNSTMSKVGRKEILTKELAKQICRLIEKMPESATPVTWENVIKHTKLRSGLTFTRQMLSQKEWNDEKLIGMAFSLAKETQRRTLKDHSPKYATSSRAVLQKRITILEAKNHALQEELESVRARQMLALDVFLNDTSDLRVLINK